MPKTECDYCGRGYYWCWEEAFAKFGFNDGYDQAEAWQVELVLAETGYIVTMKG